MVLAIKAEKISRNRDPHNQLFEGRDFKRQDTRVALRDPTLSLLVQIQPSAGLC